MSDTDIELLSRYTRQKAETAFAEIVRRHLDLVYSAALRQVCSPQLAEEVAQSVFTDLARNASRLAADTILTAWLYQVARHTAIDVVRRESRRQLREQIASEMNAMNAKTDEWIHIEPLLDEAMQDLDEKDRTAVLLRYFENKSLREVGQRLGATEDAAQKRVSRAVEQLREFFAKRGVAVGAGALALVVSTSAVQAAPAGLAATIAAVAAGTTIAVAGNATIAKAIAMTTLQKAIITVALLAIAGAEFYQARQVASLRTRLQTSETQAAASASQVAQLTGELASAKKQAVALRDDPQSANAELLRLRSQVKALRAENSRLAAKNAAKAKPADDSPIKAMVAMAVEEEKRDSTNSIMERVAGLKKTLALSSEQETTIRNILLNNVGPLSELTAAEAFGTLSAEEIKNQEDLLEQEEEAGILAALNPDQQAAYEQTKKDNAAKAAKTFGKNESARMKRELHLSSEQTENASTILAGLPPGHGGPGDAADAGAKDQLEIRLQALAPVLTPQQLQDYRERRLHEIEVGAQAANLFKNLAK